MLSHWSTAVFCARHPSDVIVQEGWENGPLAVRKVAVDRALEAIGIFDRSAGCVFVSVAVDDIRALAVLPARSQAIYANSLRLLITPPLVSGE